MGSDGCVSRKVPGCAGVFSVCGPEEPSYRAASGLAVGLRSESLPQHGQVCLLTGPWVNMRV